MTDLLKDVVGGLALVAAGAAIALFLLAVAAMLLATYRVTVLRRPFVLTFAGSDEARGPLTALFALQLLSIEREWTGLASSLQAAKNDLAAAYENAMQAPVPSTATGTPIADGADLPDLAAAHDQDDTLTGVGVGPRSVGDETIEYVLELAGANSLADAELGQVTVAGVSFSPQAILALLRRLPASVARRRISGTLGQFEGTAIIAATYEERPWRRPAKSAHRLVAVGDDWLAAIDALAFRLEKGRLEVLRELREATDAAAGDAKPASETAERGFIEAESWEACKAFLRGYERQFRHYITGTAADRDRALEFYGDAIERQPGYTRAHYNRGTLLYNRYRKEDNSLALADFELATKSEHDRLRALAFAGMALAYGQDVHRFGAKGADVAAKAKAASEEALELAPNLEESRFAKAWALQIDERWADAVDAYLELERLEAASVPGKRIKSFALNNAAWITMKELGGEEQDLLKAERLLQQAVALYPNKIAYANLAEIARRHRRYDVAEQLFERAVDLDSKYVNGWHEYALLELERAQSDPSRREEYLARSRRLQETAERAGDDYDRAKVKRAFERALAEYEAAVGTV